MNKKELIRAISQELDPPMSQDKITLVLDKAVEITKRTLATSEPVKWSGFGSFVLKDVPPRFFYSIHLKNTPPPKAQSESHSSRLALNNVQSTLK